MPDLPLRPYLRRLRRHLGRVELPVLLLVLVLAGGIWAFIGVADAISEGDTRAIDERLLLALRTPGDVSDPLGPRWVEEMSRDLTALGGVAVLVLLTAAAAAYLFLMGRRRVAWFVLAAVGGGIALSMLLKAGFDRPRPDLVPHASHVYSASFPSGHSMMAAVVYLTLGVLLARVHRYRRMKVFFLGLAVFVTVMVGASRVYVGVHWPTDVLAGWAAGAAWAVLCWLAALWFQRRNAMPETMTAESATSKVGPL